jgi:predicted RNase H-like HicB family nuclease
MDAARGKQPRIANGSKAISISWFARGRYRSRMNLPPANARFRVAIHRAQGCYFAQVLDLPGCFSRGTSEVEALENARSAIRAFLWLGQALEGDTATVQVEISA